MFNTVEIGGQLVPEESFEALAGISSNKTLLVQKLTNRPTKPEPIKGLNNLAEIFNYFKPGLVVDFEDENHSFQKVELKFGSLFDFTKEGIINQVDFLKRLKKQCDECSLFVRKLKTNKILTTAIQNTAVKKNFLLVLQTLINEIDQVNFHINKVVNEFKKQDTNTEIEPQEKFTLPEKVMNENIPFKNALETLIDYGGYDLIKDTVKEAGSMNPWANARKIFFLSDSAKKSEREELRNSLSLLIEVISSHENTASMISSLQKKSDNAVKLLNENLKKAIREIQELETSYRSVALFYQNAEKEKIQNITLFNTDLENLKDLDSTLDIDRITVELKETFERLDLRESYSLLIIPGYLGSNRVIEKWAKIAYDNKVMLITDFQHLDDPEAVMDEFDMAGLTGEETYKSNVILTCNWVLGREKYEELDEEDHLYIPPSTALAGKIYNTLISQPVAGKMHGGLSDVNGVKFALKKSEIAELEKRGMVSMVYEWGKVIGMSAKTLFTGDDINLQTYSNVRVFDYVTKAIINLINRQKYVNWSSKVENDLMAELNRLLGSIKGSDKIIDSYTIAHLGLDVDTKAICIDIHITPYFPAKKLLIQLKGERGNTADEWTINY